MRELVQSTAANVMVWMAQSSDHLTGATGLTLAVTASKDGGAFASVSPAVTERGAGWYNLALTSSHTDTLGDLALHVTAAGADASDLVSRVIATKPADVLKWKSAAVPPPNQAGVPVVDVGYVGGAAAGTSDGTAQAGGASSITLSAGDSAGASAYVDRVITLVAGTGAGQSRVVTAYDSATKVATVHRAWDTQPDATSQYAIDPTAVCGTGAAGTVLSNDPYPRVSAALPNAAPGAAGGLPLLDGSAHLLVYSVSQPVTAGTVSDKTGYSLSQGFPANFASLGITAAGKITEVALVDTLTTYAGNTPQTGDAFARLGAPAGASTAVDIAAVKSDTAAAYAKLPTNNIADETLVLAAANSILSAVGTPMQAGAHVQLATSQDQYAPAKAGDAMALTAAGYAAAADALIGRNVAGGSSTGRTVKEVLATIRNKVAISGNALTVYDTDDVSVLYTATLTTDATAVPITTVDPA